MKSLIISMVLIVASSVTLAQQGAGNPPLERIKVAAVGERIIFMDEIQIKEVIDGRQLPNKNEMVERESQRLRHLIREEVIRQEIAARDIKPSQKMVEQKANSLAEQQWQKLGATEQERKKIIETLRNKASKIYEALVVWKQDKKRGDELAKRKLEPLGITQDYWEWLTSRSKDDEFWRQIEEAKSYDKKTFWQAHLPAARRAIEIEQLKYAVIPDVSVSDAEVKRLFDLTRNTEWIEIVTVKNQRRVPAELLGELGKERSDELKGYKRLRLSGIDLTLSGVNRLYLLLIAIHCRAISPGISSNLFEWITGNEVASWLLYIVDVKFKPNIVEIQEGIKVELKKAIEDFKRNQKFELWLHSRMLEKTVIYLPKFKGAIIK